MDLERSVKKTITIRGHGAHNKIMRSNSGNRRFLRTPMDSRGEDHVHK